MSNENLNLDIDPFAEQAALEKMVDSQNAKSVDFEQTYNTAPAW